MSSTLFIRQLSKDISSMKKIEIENKNVNKSNVKNTYDRINSYFINTFYNPKTTIINKNIKS